MNSKVTAVVGHRGTGKTALMSRLQFYLSDQETVFLDLDSEIEKKIGKTISELFIDHGEAYFRELERQVFLEILQRPSPSLYLVLGAGFDLSVIPDSVRVLWIKRKTDMEGRIFLDRPRLNPELSALEEFQKRALPREQHYHERADEVYLMPEGVFDNHHQAMAVEKALLTRTLHDVGGVFTVLPDVFANESRWEFFKERYAGRGLSCFELRDDFLTKEQILRFQMELPNEKLIYSFRREVGDVNFFADEERQKIWQHCAWLDWAWELGTPERILSSLGATKLILSLHDRSAFTEWSKWEDRVTHMKYAPEVHTYTQLREAHFWQQEDSSRRSFLPRSAEGRWEWYRLRQKGRQLLNFIKEDSGSAGDQPSLWSWLMTFSMAPRWAAVLGDPVLHSFTPMEHSDFFSKNGVPVFAVAIGRDEWDEALPFLRELGLSFAAVTSPHKENAARMCRHPELKAVNTLYWHSERKMWQGASTDDQGFVELIEGIGMVSPLQGDIFVWGGGGTLEMIEKALPHASYFSSRTGLPRAGSEEASEKMPKVLIWAAPRSAETQMPPSSWNPVMVLDLNYKEDSMGREYAQKCGANYQSGLVMFTAQAQGQRAFWRQCESELR
ncbi:MAG: shikimate kinase [Bdellovibrio sp.]